MDPSNHMNLNALIKNRYKQTPILTPATILEYYDASFKGDPDSKFFSNRQIGLEIEIEKAKTANLKYFIIDNDGSLKDQGVELRSVYPMGGILIDASLKEYESYLKLNPNSVFTHRCSIHVHVNVQDLTVGQLTCIILAYICLEELFFSFVSPIRRNNPYCSALADYIDEFTLIFNGDNYDSFKYFALNPGVMQKFGSIEFRHLDGTKDLEKLKTWIRLLQTFVDHFSTITNYKEFYNTINKLNSTSYYYKFVTDIFGNNPWPMEDLKKMMERNVLIAKGHLN